MLKKILTLLGLLYAYFFGGGQTYPQHYFRSPLDIPMSLVANFGEIRPNHWHMGLDIRTQQKVNLPVYAAAEGYIARISIEPGGFGQAIYIAHPNGYTTLYAHLNAFYAPLAAYIKQQQYAKESWEIDTSFLPSQFPVKKGALIGLSGSTGGSQGPHVHFEIRDTKTEKVLNPLLFGFPIPDAVPPTVSRLVMYDRNQSTYVATPQLLNLSKIKGAIIKVGSNKISFAVGATDRFTGSTNPNGIYFAETLLDGEPVSSFTLNDIGYDETRYINAQIDYPLAARGGGAVQHITPLPGAVNEIYATYGEDGIIHLKDTTKHVVTISVQDANKNTTSIHFFIQYLPELSKPFVRFRGEMLQPNTINIFEQDNFQIITSDKTIYDTVPVNFEKTINNLPGSLSQAYTFLSAAIPAHDYFTLRLKTTSNIPDQWKDRLVLNCVSGKATIVQKANWQTTGWVMAKFRQFGTYQAFIDSVPPTINNVAGNLSKASRIIFTPRDNFGAIKNFRAELDGHWLRFSNDKGKSWIYTFDEKFLKGEHELKVKVEDEAGNVTEKVWMVKR